MTFKAICLAIAAWVILPVFGQTTSPMQFKLASTGGVSCCEWISAEGQITGETPAAFVSFLKEWNNDLEGRTTIYLNSPGGNLVAGMRLGELFRKGKFATDVGTTSPMPGSGKVVASRLDPGICMSACAYAFLGGVNRGAKAGELGFHQFYSPPSTGEAVLKSPDKPDDASTAQLIVGLIAIYLKEMGIDPEVLFLASSTSASDLYLPDVSTMRQLRIINQHDEDQFDGWTIEPYRGGAVVTGSLTDRGNIKTQLTLFCRRSNPGQVFVLGSWSHLTPEQNQASSQTASVQSAVFGSRLKIGSTTVREQKGLDGIADLHVDNSGRFYLTYPLTSAEFAQGLQNGITVEINVPHSYDWLFRLAPPVQGLRERTAIAFKSCL